MGIKIVCCLSIFFQIAKSLGPRNVGLGIVSPACDPIRDFGKPSKSLDVMQSENGINNIHAVKIERMI